MLVFCPGCAEGLGLDDRGFGLEKEVGITSYAALPLSPFLQPGFFSRLLGPDIPRTLPWGTMRAKSLPSNRRHGYRTNFNKTINLFKYWKRLMERRGRGFDDGLVSFNQRQVGWGVKTRRHECKFQKGDEDLARPAGGCLLRKINRAAARRRIDTA